MTTNQSNQKSQKIAVAGATGTLGVHVMDAVRAAGHHPVAISRAAGVDLTTGAGLADALSGVAAVIDVSGSATMSAKRSRAFFGTATRALLEAERAAGVRHHVAISIVGAAQVPSGYYAGKALQEELLQAQPGGWSILRTTQFHEFAPQMVEQMRVGPVQLVPSMRSQPVAASEVAAELVAIALGEPQGLAPDLAGPREERMADMVRRYLAATGVRRPVWQVRVPGALGRGMRGGALVAGPGARLGRQTYDEWLAGLGAPAGQDA